MNNIPLYPENLFIKPYGLPFRAMYYAQSMQSCIHYHDFEELVCVLRGHALHECDSRKYPISVGDIFLIRSGSTHGYTDLGNLQVANLMFPADYLRTAMPALDELPGYRAFFETEPIARRQTGFKPVLNIAGGGLNEIQLVIAKLEQECKERPLGFKTMAAAYFCEIITLVSRCYGSDEKNSSRRMVTLSRMTGFIENHFSEPISRNDILRVGCVSASTGSRLFHELLRKSMIDYLTEVRINHAKRILTETDLSITEAAFKCGFSDSSYFSACFHRLTGYSPKTFRATN